MSLEILPRTELTRRLLRSRGDGARRRAVDIATESGSPANSVARPVGPLPRAGWVRSVPGPTGSRELIAGLDVVSVLDLITNVEGGPENGRCVMTDRPTPAPQPCALHDAWIPAREAMTAQLASTSLSSLTTCPEVPS
ncbi:MAG: Rrf2 family transcriptional regulator [Ilumatobacteraceae bacterium]